MDSSQQFYGFAAIVIPVLLFGGAVAEQWVPHAQSKHRWHAAGAAIVAMLFAIVAELVAIDAAFTGRTSSLGGAIVAFAVVGGTVAAAGAVTWPWRTYLGRLYPVIAVVTILGAGGWTIVNGFRATYADPPPSAIDQAVLRLAEQQRQETARLVDLAKRDLATRGTLRHAFRSLTRELSRADAALIRTAKRQ